MANNSLPALFLEAELDRNEWKTLNLLSRWSESFPLLDVLWAVTSDSFEVLYPTREADEVAARSIDIYLVSTFLHAEL